MHLSTSTRTLLSFHAVLLVVLAAPGDCFSTARYPSFIITTQLLASPDDSTDSARDSSRRAEFLPLSEDDLNRLSKLQSRQLTMPILFLDAMVPKQRLTFQSTDPKFRRLLETCVDENYSEIGMFGLNPITKKPLCNGVSLPVSEDAIEHDPATGLFQLTVTAKRRVEVQGEPWLDDTESFYMANVELVDDREELMTAEQLEETKRLSRTLPGLVNEWKTQVLRAQATDLAGLETRCAVIGDMPPENALTERALWIAALINPLPALGVSLEIRPAMLSVANGYLRMVLACEAIQSSIDHLSGKKRLF
jgi:hypothetical protein